MRRPGGWPGLSVVLLTDLIIRVGGKLLCQLFFGFMLFSWCELGGFLGVEGLDRKTGNRKTGKQGTGNREQGTARARAKAYPWGDPRLKPRATTLGVLGSNGKSKGKGGGFVGERGGGLWMCGVRRGPSTASGAKYAPDSAQDDSVKQATAKCGGPSTARRTIRPSAAPVGMTASI
jgi:hypothetical protein